MYEIKFCSQKINKNEATVTGGNSGTFLLAYHTNVTYVFGKDLLIVNIQQCFNFHFQATSERSQMTECTCPNCNAGDLGSTDKVKDNITVLLTLGIRNYISNLHVHGVIIKTIIQSLWATLTWATLPSAQQ